jgi:hypothetical protein
MLETVKFESILKILPTINLPAQKDIPVTTQIENIKTTIQQTLNTQSQQDIARVLKDENKTFPTNFSFSTLEEHVKLLILESYLAELSLIIKNTRSFSANIPRTLTDKVTKITNLLADKTQPKRGGNAAMTGIVAVTSIGSQLSISMALMTILILTIIFLCYLIYNLKTENQSRYIIKYYPNVQISA